MPHIAKPSLFKTATGARSATKPSIASSQGRSTMSSARPLCQYGSTRIRGRRRSRLFRPPKTNNHRRLILTRLEGPGGGYHIVSGAIPPLNTTVLDLDRGRPGDRDPTATSNRDSEHEPGSIRRPHCRHDTQPGGARLHADPWLSR